MQLEQSLCTYIHTTVQNYPSAIKLGTSKNSLKFAQANESQLIRQ